MVQYYTDQNWPRKYGQSLPPSEHAPARGFFEAVEAPVPRGGVTPSDVQKAIDRQNATLEAYQRKQLHTFTTRELLNLGVITSANLRPSTLTNGLIQLFQKTNWESVPRPEWGRQTLYPVDCFSPHPDNLSGNWVAENPLVWKAIEPSLQLASRIIAGDQMLLWFDTLFFGMRGKVPSRRIPNYAKKYFRMETLDPKPVNSKDKRTVASERDRLFAVMEKDYRFILGFGRMGEDAISGMPVQNAFAVTHCGDNPDTISMFLSYDWILPMLRPDLNDCDRMSLEWFLATVIVHEMTHAFWFVKSCERFSRSVQRQRGWDREPYFQQHSLYELGSVSENEIFGGIPEVMYNGLCSPPLGFFLSEEFPNITWAEISNCPALINPPVTTKSTYWPIKASFYENVQQEDFWAVGIRAYGTSLLRATTTTQGVTWNNVYRPDGAGSRKLDAEALSRTTKPFDIDFTERIARLVNITPQELANFSPAERIVYDFGSKMYNSAIFTRDFWNSEKYQEDVILRHRDTIATALENNQNLNDVVTQLFTFIAQSRKAHESSAQCLRNAERLLGTIYPNQRHQLLMWNRGTRIFLKGCAIEFSDRIVESAFIQAEREGLEYTRMLLFKPFDITGIAGYSDEMAALNNISQDLMDEDPVVLYSCRRLRMREDCSFFAEACCDAVIAFVGGNSSTSSRIERATRGLNRLQVIKRGFYSPIPAAFSHRLPFNRPQAVPQMWVAVVEMWNDRAEHVVKSLQNKFAEEQRQLVEEQKKLAEEQNQASTDVPEAMDESEG